MSRVGVREKTNIALRFSSLKYYNNMIIYFSVRDNYFKA